MYRSFFKRFFDLLVSLILFIGLLPLFLLVTVLLLLLQKDNPFFFQIRPGKDGKLFTLIKFKTMHDRKDAAGDMLPDEERFTVLGPFLRKFSLDEIPQLLNVIAGDMSLVGPRPLLPEYLSLYNNYQARRHEVLPGITGWAQINGRNAISWESKFEYDHWYLDHISLSTDVKIILLTLKKVIARKDVNADSKVTMKKFTGTPNT